MKRACVAGLLLLASCNRPRQPAVRIASFTPIDAYPFRLAQELGHFREERLQVSIEEFSGGTKIMERPSLSSAPPQATTERATASPCAPGPSRDRQPEPRNP